MGRHSAIRRSTSGLAILGVCSLVAVGGGAMVVAAWRSADNRQSAAPPVVKCSTVVRVVTAGSFAPVLTALAPSMASGEDCARLDVRVADGRKAAQQIEHMEADLWIPDDPSWAPVAGGDYAEVPKPVVVATSPLYFVTDRRTARTVTSAGRSWLGLANLVEQHRGIRPVLRDPAGSGDGLLAAGAIGEAVWLKSGMDVSAEVLAATIPVSRTTQGSAPARPAKELEVGLVPEYALLKQSWPDDQVVLAPADHTAQLRYTWLPYPEAREQPKVAKAMDRLLRTLRGPAAAPELAAAGLRGPDGNTPSSVETRRLPRVTAKPFDVLEPHHVDHVFASWYPADRRSDILLVVDISGSMGAPAPGTRLPLIRSVARGCGRLAALLPNDSQLALWEFGSKLDPPRDYRTLLQRGPLSAAHRHALGIATAALTARSSGTGLYDTLLAAYLSARNSYRKGTPNQVVLFTDGRNEDDPGSLTAQQLTSALKKANDPQRPVQLSVITFGQKAQAAALEKVLEPVDGAVKELTSANEVDATFIHVAAGGLDH